MRSEQPTTVSIVNRQRVIRLDVPALRLAATVALQAERLDDREVTLVFVTDRQIARLNKQYLDHPGPTDVLAFGCGGVTNAPAVQWLGDVVISVETAQRQAPQWRRTMPEELAEYVIHGVLHLAGYDDGRVVERRRMHRRQAALFRQWRSGRLTRSS